MRKWKDYFCDECDACGESIEDLLYVINQSMGICGDCYENTEIYIIDEEIYILEGENK
tara:strand:+ start:3599 stop:3772 length:174 start_codon:yes stop_codon:yes gene_type:complete